MNRYVINVGTGITGEGGREEGREEWRKGEYVI
jgi:hypothetical protein